MYTKGETNAFLDGKADKATTLAGYGIADAYTKSEVDAKVTSVYRYKGTVSTYADLPSSGQEVGDVWNIETADSAHGIKAGDNVAWNGSAWDSLSGVVDLTPFALKDEASTDHNHDGKYIPVTGCPLTNFSVEGKRADGSSIGTGRIIYEVEDRTDAPVDNLTIRTQRLRLNSKEVFFNVRPILDGRMANYAGGFVISDYYTGNIKSPGEFIEGNTKLSDKYAAKSELATVATTGDYNDLTNRPDLTTKLDAPAVAGTVGQVLTKTADGQEWKDFGIDDIAQECQTLRDQTEAIYESVKATVATYYVGPAYNYGVTVDGTMLSFTWTDPADNNVVKWARTRLVMKTGGFPADESDGTVLIDVTTRNQHKTVPFTWDAGVISGYYFALFTQTTGGVWNTGDDCPRFTTDELTWVTIVMMSRAGTLLQYPGMEIGSVVDIKVNDLYPKMRYMLADIDYTGSFAKVSDFMYDNTRTHNSIWIPHFVPSLGEGNSTATMMQFDAPESSYGATWDDVFITGKAYYTVSGESYTQLTAGTDYQAGESVAEWQTLHGDTVYTKNHTDRAYGNNIWKESNMRQWLNSTGNDWFRKQNEYDVRSGSTGYSSGWMTGFVPGFLDLVMPVYNKTARNKLSAIEGGGGGGYDITLDKFWLPSLKEFNGGNVNDIAEGSQFAYFRDVATTNTQRIQYDEGGTARNVWLRSPYANSAHYEHYINTSGASSYYTADGAYAFQPAMCL